MHINEVSGVVIDAAMKVHSALGPGLLESTYEACVCFELNQRSVNTLRQVELPVAYGNVKIDCGYRIDLLVDNTVIVEVESVESLAPVHQAQLLTYLRLSNKHVGLLINFNAEHLKDAIKRLINSFSILCDPLFAVFTGVR